MSDSTGSLLPADVAASAELLQVLLDVSLTGVILFRPVYDARGTAIIDLAYVRLNPAAQQMLHRPACPPESFLTLYPSARTTGVFEFYQRAFLSGAVERFQVNYSHDGLDGYFYLVAQRHGPLLVVSFTDTNEYSRSVVEKDLRQSQGRELAARAEAEAERNLLQNLLTQAPVAIGLFQGPELRITAANNMMAAIWGRPLDQVIGRPILEALPELRGQGFDEQLTQVMHAQAPVTGTETPAVMQRDGKLQTTYYNFVYQPLYDAQGQVQGVLDIAIDVTEQVRARQQVQRLNDELETRVAERTAETQAALREAQAQREQLRVQQGLLRQILGQVPAAIATLGGPEHRYTFFNEPYQKLAAGRTQLGQTVADMLPEVVEQGFVGLLDQVYATGQPFIGTETLVMLHDQATGQPEQRYVDFIYQPLFDGQQQPQGVLAFILDVTDRVRARKQADTLQAAMLAVVKRQGQERENVFQLFEQAPAAICLLREPEHRIDYLNPAYQALFPGQALRGRTQAQAVPDDPDLVTLLDGIYQTGQAQFKAEKPVHIPQPNGQPPLTRYFNFTYQAYREEGRIAGVSIFAFDVTEQVLVRRQRDAQQAELQRIFEQAPVAIAIMRGPELVVELANMAVGTIWGRSPAQVLGRPYFEAVPDTAGQGFEEILGGVLRSGESLFITEAPVQLDRSHTGQPTLAYVNFVFQPLLDGNPVATGLIAIGTEVTEQVHARQQVQVLNEELQAANKELGSTNDRLTRTNTDLDTFVYTASHDLRAPISNIEGLLRALHEQLSPEALREPLVLRILELMNDAVARFQQTIGHLTDISQLQQLEVENEAVNVAALVKAVRLDLAPLLHANQARLTVEVAEDISVQFTPKNLRSVVYNLLSNAVKYHAQGRPPVVALRCYRTENRVVLSVQDNGLGLTEAQQGKLFRMFRRLHSHVEGSGVGLYMVKRQIENAGGTITVQSEAGVGSTFTVSLPG